ncbi:HET-domain-containing protein [Dendrothele bispora CBS 962.96]|uniref:HET-domain-containing protein n=1 Tax=Dendrothele bispora (strain CBS 962.96) TaxID=1314807 RepID=A0A4S8LET2_DENBC|nr:HET-domain-containing protein [Dendrothele bispora CBS 962.96]
MLPEIWSALPGLLLSPTSSDWSSSENESIDSNEIPDRSTGTEDVPRDIQKLVCETCWRTVFSAESFQTIWESVHTGFYLKSAGYSYKTPTWQEIRRQRRRHLINFQHQCEWCRIVGELIKKTRPRQEPPEEKTPYQVRVRFDRNDGVTVLSLLNDKEESRFPILAFEDDPAAKFIPDRDIFPDVDSNLAYDLIKKRVFECSHHEQCSPPQRAHLPTRVIDCLDPSQPRLFITNGIEGYYLALSYVWGEHQPNRLKNENFDSYIQRIPAKEIPKTIMDAITVTHKLGFRYLWVDSYCILQDSEDDKAREIAQIPHIFRHSYVTIIGACAHKVSDGFLHDRRPTVGNLKLSSGETLLPFRCPDGNIGTMRLVMGGNLSPIPEPVDERAWCLEERTLSPRRLIYATHTLMYECQTTHNNINDAPNYVPLCGTEDIPRLPNDLFLRPPSVSLNSNLSSSSSSSDEITQAWYNIVTMYTQRTLTSAKDRLNALAGIAEQFHHFWPNSRYFAGLWEHQLPAGLLWDNNLLGGKCRRRPDVCHAPSWSWASRDGEVVMRWCRNDGMFCTVIHLDVRPHKEVNPFGEVEVGGSLVLETILQQARWVVDKRGKGDLFALDSAPSGHLGDQKASMQPSIGFAQCDAIDPSQRTSNIYLAFVGKNQFGGFVCGLVLVPVSIGRVTSPGQHNYPVFRRVGSFEALDTLPEMWLKSKRQRITVV